MHAVVLALEGSLFAFLPYAITMGDHDVVMVLCALAFCFGAAKVGIPAIVAAIFPLHHYGVMFSLQGCLLGSTRESILGTQEAALLPDEHLRVHVIGRRANPNCDAGDMRLSLIHI